MNFKISNMFLTKSTEKQIDNSKESNCAVSKNLIIAILEKTFWAELKKLGPRKKEQMPSEVYDSYGDVTSDPSGGLFNLES